MNQNENCFFVVVFFVNGQKCELNITAPAAAQPGEPQLPPELSHTSRANDQLKAAALQLLYQSNMAAAAAAALSHGGDVAAPRTPVTRAIIQMCRSVALCADKEAECGSLLSEQEPPFPRRCPSLPPPCTDARLLLVQSRPIKSCLCRGTRIRTNEQRDRAGWAGQHEAVTGELMRGDG